MNVTHSQGQMRSRQSTGILALLLEGVTATLKKALRLPQRQTFRGTDTKARFSDNSFCLRWRKAKRSRVEKKEEV
jgi:hypothetical protein